MHSNIEKFHWIEASKFLTSIEQKTVDDIKSLFSKYNSNYPNHNKSHKILTALWVDAVSISVLRNKGKHDLANTLMNQRAYVLAKKLKWQNNDVSNFYNNFGLRLKNSAEKSQDFLLYSYLNDTGEDNAVLLTQAFGMAFPLEFSEIITQHSRKVGVLASEGVEIDLTE